jgi:nuclear transport factor 2 (NTF2) superfamily protein
MRMASEDAWCRRCATRDLAEHVDTLWRDRWTKDDVRKRIQEITSRPIRELFPTDDYGGLGAMPE